MSACFGACPRRMPTELGREGADGLARVGEMMRHLPVGARAVALRRGGWVYTCGARVLPSDFDALRRRYAGRFYMLRDGGADDDAGGD